MRLIDADALLEAGKNTYEFQQHLADEYDFECLVVGTPTVDAVPVVRCRDCKNSFQYDDGSDNYVCVYGCRSQEGGFFCSKGERREEDED